MNSFTCPLKFLSKNGISFRMNEMNFYPELLKSMSKNKICVRKLSRKLLFFTWIIFRKQIPVKIPVLSNCPA